MGIEKMTFLDISGHVDQLDDVLLMCLRSGMFQPEYAAKLSEYSVGSSALMRNPYGALMVKIADVAAQLGITLPAVDPADLGSYTSMIRDAFIEDCHDYLNTLRKEYPGYFERQRKTLDEITSYGAALDMLSHVSIADLDMGDIWNNEFLKIRFGRLPSLNFPKLSDFEDKPYEVCKLDEQGGYVWCLYFTAGAYQAEIDQMFYTLGFERLRIPEYVRGTAAEAMESIQKSLESEKASLEEAGREIQAFIEREQKQFFIMHANIKYFHDAYDLRKYVVSLRDHFHLVGYVLTRQQDEFLALFQGVPDLNVEHSPGEQSRLPVPVKLRNNWFVRPFEMFVHMYGAPSYNDIDPTPFLAWTYTLLFGIMFGDMGHGLCVALLGWFLWKKKNMPLGGIMTRIGISAMVTGFLYGSVFGFEHLLDFFYVGLLGLAEKPIEVLHPDTTTKILIAAVGLGAVSIMSAISFNMVSGIRRRDWERTLLSSNGLCGLVFYASVLLGAIGVLQGKTVFTTPYVLLFIVLPLVLIFFKEPISEYAHLRSKDSIISHDSTLVGSSLLESDTNIPELFGSPFMTARFGRIPTDSYNKLSFYKKEPFMLYPVKTDQEYIWLIYATAIPNKAEIDAIFHDLYFERIFIPENDLRSTQEAEAFIEKCIEMGAPPPPETAEAEERTTATASRPRTLFQKLFPEGVGSFITVTFFEMFEVVLSFVSNTMSFLRVGGFVLVHAGMMSVVFTLAQMVNSGGATLSVIIIGNLFVMGMEGMIVGIQVLRLEFYELFSRFYGENGEPFTPIQMVRGA